jgi:tRNA-2-methylthio-N6-dimethylallyladenosine synthase
MLYDKNPTIEGITKIIDENKQGTPFFDEQFINSSNSSGKLFYIESYGCAMNFSDSEIVASILLDSGYQPTRNMEESDLILINTCSIREKAEDNVRKRLQLFNIQKRKRPGTMIGVLGCMAERLKAKFLEEEKLVDIVVGPDAYRDLPNLLAGASDGERGVNVLLSREETYSDISPVRLDSNGVSAYISIMRGCDNMCSFCVVPFTRGRERSRDTYGILAEATDLIQKGYKEITLLGQNVDSYKWTNPETNQTVSFAALLELVALLNPIIRVRFSTSHPKDITDEVLHTIAKYQNICNYIHLPVQSGNSRVLALMNRTYDRKWYTERVNKIYEILPDCTISSDMISGFCTENQDTLSLMEYVKFTYAYMYYYSERPGTLAARKLADDIPLETKKRRLQDIVDLQRILAYNYNKNCLGKTYEVLIEGNSKKSDQEYKGRNQYNTMFVFPKAEGYKVGDYVQVKVLDANSATLKGEIVK